MTTEYFMYYQIKDEIILQFLCFCSKKIYFSCENLFYFIIMLHKIGFTENILSQIKNN